jgi:predicted negative regulator of RcsB-dependent stress response
MSTPASANLKEDRVIVGLAKLQNWFSDNWKWILILVLVCMGYAFITEKSRKDQIKEEQKYWEQAAKATTIEQRAKFVNANSERQAAKVLSLQLTRQYLDEGNYKQALGTISKFIEKNPNHPFMSIALTLKAYAHEELGEVDQALQVYQEVSAKGDIMSVLSEQYSERLQEK